MICIDNVRIVLMINGICNLVMERKRLILVYVVVIFIFECWFNLVLILFMYRIVYVLWNFEYKRDFEDMFVIIK